MKKCIICQNQTTKVFENKILTKYCVDYFLCNNCGFLQTEKPYWIEEAYSDAIATADTGLVLRNQTIQRRLSVLLYLLFGKDGHYVDIAGGTGLLVRMMRDIGFDFYWKDSYCRNIHARGFEFETRLNPCNSVTAFEVIEHLENPVSFIVDALNQADSKTFIFTTELFNGPPPAPDTWWYYTPDTGQHISFYQQKTLQNIANQLGFRFYTSAGIHMMSEKIISPAIYALAVGRTYRLAFPFVKGIMNSKTTDDHLSLLRKEQ